MNNKFFALLLATSFASPCLPASSNTLDVTACGTRGATIVLQRANGKWLGVSAMTDSGKILDFPPRKVKELGTLGIGSHKVTFGGSSSVEQVRASTWSNFNDKTGLMEERLDDTGWVDC